MFQDTDLPMLPPHLRDSFLRPRVYSQFEFQIFFSEIWDSGFSDLISRNQQIRVVNYTKWMAMRETRMCLTCEGKWCEDHECENSCVVLFNPYDRDDEYVETQEEMVEEVETCLSGDKVVQVNEVIEQEMETEFKELNDSTMFGDSFDREIEFDMGERSQSDPIMEFEAENRKQFMAGFIRNDDKSAMKRVEEEGASGLGWNVGLFGEKDQDQFEENAKEKMQPDLFCSWKEAGSYDELQSIDEKDTLGQTLEGNLKKIADLMFEGLKVFDDSSEKEWEPDLMFEGLELFDDKPHKEHEQESFPSREFSETDDIQQFKQRQVKPHAYILLSDIVKNDKKIHDIQEDLVWTEYKIFKNLFGLFEWYNQTVVLGCVHICEKDLECIKILKRVIQKNMSRCGVKKDFDEMSRLTFDPGGKWHKNRKNVNHDSASDSEVFDLLLGCCTSGGAYIPAMVDGNVMLKEMVPCSGWRSMFSGKDLAGLLCNCFGVFEKVSGVSRICRWSFRFLFWKSVWFWFRV